MQHQAQYQKKPFNWRWFLTAVAVVLLCTYVYFCPLINPREYSLVIFHPEQKADGPWEISEIAGRAYDDVFFKTANGKKLHGWYFEKPNAKYTFLVHHGNGGNLSDRTAELKLLLGTGSNVLIFDYQGYGLSEGSPSLLNARDDASYAYKFLRDVKNVEPQHIILFGESLGSAFAGNLSTKEKCAGVVLQCPLASIKRRGSEIISTVTRNAVSLDLLYPSFMWPELGFDNTKTFQNSHPPVLLVAGSDDPMIPIAHAKDIFDSACEPKTLVIIEGAGHTGDVRLLNAPEYSKALTKFLQTLNRKSTEGSIP